MRIIVSPEYLHILAQDLQRAAQQLHTISNHISSAFNRMDAEARVVSGTEGRVRQAQSYAQRLGQDAETMARYVANKAQLFENADRQGVIDIAPLGVSYLQMLQELQQYIYRDLSNYVADRLLYEVFPALMIYASTSKEFLGIMANLAKDRDEIIKRGGNLADFLQKQLPHDGFIDKLLKNHGAKGLVAIDALSGAVKDWSDRAYDGDIFKIIGVNSTKALIEFGISGTKAGGVVLLLNAAGQIAVNSDIYVSRIIGNLVASNQNVKDILQSEADTRKKAIDDMDLGNVTKSISELIYDVKVQPYVNLARHNLDALSSIYHEPTADNAIKVFQSLQKSTVEDVKNILFSNISPQLYAMSNEQTRQDLVKVGMSVVKMPFAVDNLISTTVTQRDNIVLSSFAKAFDMLPVPAEAKDNIVSGLEMKIYVNDQMNKEKVQSNDKIVQGVEDLSKYTMNAVVDQADRTYNWFLNAFKR